MKIEMEIDGLTCKASTDFSPLSSLDTQTYASVNAGIFTALKLELRAAVTKLIEAKYAKGKEE